MSANQAHRMIEGDSDFRIMTLVLGEYPRIPFEPWPASSRGPESPRVLDSCDNPLLLEKLIFGF